MPQSRSWRARSRILGALATPGMYLVYKYNQYRRQVQENQRRKVTERELQHLNHKIDKLLVKLDEQDCGGSVASSPGTPDTVPLIPSPTQTYNFSEDEECVVCLSAKASMQTFPCGHKVVCRKCFVKTIQVAVTQRCLPLRCVVCRTRILKLKARDEGTANNQDKTTSSKGASLRQLFASNRSSSHGETHSKPSPTHGTKPVATKIMQPLLIFPADNAPKRQQAFTHGNTAAPPASLTRSQRQAKDPSTVTHGNTAAPPASLTRSQKQSKEPSPILKAHQGGNCIRSEHFRAMSPSSRTTRSRSASRSRTHNKHVTFAEPLAMEKRVHAAHICTSKGGMAQDDTTAMLSPRITRCPRNGHEDLTRGSNLSPQLTRPARGCSPQQSPSSRCSPRHTSGSTRSRRSNVVIKQGV